MTPMLIQDLNDFSIIYYWMLLMSYNELKYLLYHYTNLSTASKPYLSNPHTILISLILIPIDYAISLVR